MKRMMIGGVEEVEDGCFVPTFEIHEPCDGDQHRSCTVVHKFVGTKYSSMGEAAGKIYEIAAEWKPDNANGDWSPVGPKA